MSGARGVFDYPVTSDAKRITLLIPADRRSTVDNLGWQSVYHLLNSDGRLSVIPLFYENGVLVDIDGDTANPERIVLTSISYEINAITFLSILNRFLGGCTVYAGGYAFASNPYFLSGVIAGSSASEFDMLTAGERTAFIDAVVSGERPKLFDGSTIVSASSSGASPAHSVIISPHSAFGNAFVIEVNRGCPFACRFCEIPSVRTLRYTPLAEIKKIVTQIPSDIRRVALVGSALASHPEFTDMISFLLGAGYEVSFASLRADMLDGNAIRLIASTGTATLTLAPETGSERLKKVLHKSISREKLIAAVTAALDHGMKRFKCYYMLGVPGEEDADVTAIADEMNDIMTAAKKDAPKRGWMPIVNVSVNPYIIKRTNRKPDDVFIDKSTWTKRTRMLSKALAAIGGINATFHDYHEARLEGMLSFAPAEAAIFILHEKLYEASYKRIADRLAKEFPIPSYT
ncbi:MAG: radical SAM protein [Spirochaetes bacterium]|nr:radical SAM protein [Spirochaetota bacterium]